jgi:hypothetical protein
LSARCTSGHMQQASGEREREEEQVALALGTLALPSTHLL